MKKRDGYMKSTRTALSLTLVVATMATSVTAQDPVPAQPVPGMAFGLAPGMDVPSNEKLGGAKQFQMMSIYAMEIRRVHAAVKLEDAQKTKLTIGAKGLAKKKAKEFVKNSMGMGMGIAMPIGGATPAAQPTNDESDIKFAEVKSFADIDPNTKGMLDGGLTLEAKPYDDADWLKLAKAVLKPEQFTKYEQVIAANKLRTDKAMVEAGVAELSLDLALSKDQASKLIILVLEQMAKAKRIPGLADQIVMAMQMEGSQLTLELAKLDSSKLESILTPQQFEQINLKLQILKDIVDRMNPDISPAPAEAK